MLILLLAQTKIREHSGPAMKNAELSKIAEPRRPTAAQSRAVNRARTEVSNYSDFERENVLNIALAIASGAACVQNRPR